MILTVTAHLDYRIMTPSDVLLQIEAAPMPDQQLVKAAIGMSPVRQFNRIAAQDGIGERIWLSVTDRLTCDYQAQVEITRAVPDLATLGADPLHGLPGDVVPYLFPSRYCPSDEFQAFVTRQFGTLQGGPRVAAMRDWTQSSLHYAPGSSDAQTTARETFVHRQGICRDFAHLLITLSRASAIPARMVSGYAHQIDPQDFHALVEVWLDGAWHLTDPTGMARVDQFARIAVGRDAADVSFMTCFGRVEMLSQTVWVQVDTGG